MLTGSEDKYFLEILDDSECLKILMNCLFGTTCTVIYLTQSNLRLQYAMLPVSKA